MKYNKNVTIEATTIRSKNCQIQLFIKIFSQYNRIKRTSCTTTTQGYKIATIKKVVDFPQDLRISFTHIRTSRKMRIPNINFIQLLFFNLQIQNDGTSEGRQQFSWNPITPTSTINQPTITNRHISHTKSDSWRKTWKRST